MTETRKVLTNLNPIPETVTRRARILIVDDDPGVARVLRLILRRHHEVSIEDRGASALSRIVAGERFDLILSDVMMPGMTGIELLSELKRVAPAQAERVVFLTGGTSGRVVREGVASAHSHVISKPFDTVDILAVVAERLDAMPPFPNDHREMNGRTVGDSQS